MRDSWTRTSSTNKEETMTFYSRYRRKPISDNIRAVICAIVVCIGWAVVSETDYQDAISVAQTPCLYRGK